MVRRNAVERNVVVTMGNNSKPNQDIHVKTGMIKAHIKSRIDFIKSYQKTSAEIMVLNLKPFGATPLTQTKDGNTVM